MLFRRRSRRNRVVVLIDEIDKADSAVPNALLEALGTGSFTPPGRKSITAKRWPLIIVTTNEDRPLPPAFLRRCLVHNMDPKQGELQAWLFNRGQALFQEAPSEILNAAAEAVVQDRAEAVRSRTAHRPGAGGISRPSSCFDENGGNRLQNAQRQDGRNARILSRQIVNKRRDTPADVSRADLIRVGLDPRLAEIVGFFHDAERRKQEEETSKCGEKAGQGGSHETPPSSPSVQPGPLAPLEFLILTQASYRQVSARSLPTDTLAQASPVWENRPSQLPEPIPLADERRLQTLYAMFAPGRCETRAPDVNAVINQIVKAYPLKSIPRKRYKTERHIQIVADRSARLAPFWQDQRLAMLAAPDTSHLWIFEEAAGRFRKIGDQSFSSPASRGWPNCSTW